MFHGSTETPESNRWSKPSGFLCFQGRFVPSANRVGGTDPGGSLTGCCLGSLLSPAIIPMVSCSTIGCSSISSLRHCFWSYLPQESARRVVNPCEPIGCRGLVATHAHLIQILKWSHFSHYSSWLYHWFLWPQNVSHSYWWCLVTKRCWFLMFILHCYPQ